MECAECHRPASRDPDGQWRLRKPEPPSHAYCAQCHSDRNGEDYTWSVVGWKPGKNGGISDEPVTERRSAEDMLEVMVQGVSSRAGNPEGAFVHSKHLVMTPELQAYLRGESTGEDSQAACLVCHVPLGAPRGEAASRADWSSETCLSTRACAQCHTGAMDAEPVFRDASLERPSRAAGSFMHETHLGGERPAACVDCHSWDGEVGDFTWRLGGSDASSLAARCFECHADVQGAPGREQASQLAAFHFGRSASDCLACHSEEHDGRGNLAWHALREQRGFDSVEFEADLRFRLGEFEHPGGADGLDADGRACAECHKGPFESVAAGEEFRVFRHADHLSRDLAPGDLEGNCNRCHGELRELGPPGEWGGELQAYLGSLMGPATRDSEEWRPSSLAGLGAESCSSCHLAGDGRATEVQAVPANGAGPSKRLRFAHRDHEQTSCSDCHVPDPEAADLLGFAAGVVDCTLCHTHAHPRDGLVAAQHGLGEAGLRDCSVCHAPGLPLVSEPPRIRRTVAEVAGAFKHPVLDERQDCSRCHQDRTYADVADRDGGSVQTFDGEWPMVVEGESELGLRYLGFAYGSGDQEFLSPHLSEYAEIRKELLREYGLAEGEIGFCSPKFST